MIYQISPQKRYQKSLIYSLYKLVNDLQKTSGNNSVNTFPDKISAADAAGRLF